MAQNQSWCKFARNDTASLIYAQWNELIIMKITAILLEAKLAEIHKDNNQVFLNCKAALKVLTDSVLMDYQSDDLSEVLTVRLFPTLNRIKTLLIKQGKTDDRISNITSLIRTQLTNAVDAILLPDSPKQQLIAFAERINKIIETLPNKKIEIAAEINDELSGVSDPEYITRLMRVSAYEKRIAVSDKTTLIVNGIDKKLGFQGRFALALENYYRDIRKNTRKYTNTRASDYIDKNDMTAKQINKTTSFQYASLLEQNKAPDNYRQYAFSPTLEKNLTSHLKTFITEVNDYKTIGIVKGSAAIGHKTRKWARKELQASDSKSIFNKFSGKHYRCTSAANFWKGIGAYIAFLILPEEPDAKYFKSSKKILDAASLELALEKYTGLGMDISEVSIAHLFDTDILSQFIAQKTSTGQDLSCFKFIVAMRSITKIEGSYFTLSNFANKYLSENLKDKFDDLSAANLRDYINQYHLLLKVYEEQVDKGALQSESKDKLDFILKRDRPLSFLMDVLDVAGDVPIDRMSAKAKFTHIRNTLLTNLVTYNPLRANSIASLTIPYSTAKGTLRQKIDGGYRIVFSKDHFKNLKEADKGKYEADFPVTLIPLLEEYLALREGVLKGEDNLYLFVSDERRESDIYRKNGKLYGKRNIGHGMTSMNISQTFKDFTTRYRPANEKHFQPFGIHAARFIVATTFLRVNPENYMTVAEILHDKLETVIERYGQMSTSRGLVLQYDLVNDMRSERESTVTTNAA